MNDSLKSQEPHLEDIRFLKDEPAAVDEFGSHERLADTIASVIVRQPELNVIGLLGRWGSGKSTVIKLVKTKIEGDPSVLCFTYDAWIHQNDPPRRSFLETFIRYVVSADISKDYEWSDTLEKLAGRQAETETTTHHKLTPSAPFIIISLFAAAVGLPLLGFETIRAAWSDKATHFGQDVFWLAALLVTSPALTALGIYAWWRPWGWPIPSDFRTHHRHPYHDKSIISLFMNRAVEREQKQTIKTPDPTAIEFHSIFQEVTTAVTKARRRIIFVVDNLDRLPETESMAMWGTIRSLFFESDGVAPIDARNQAPTVLVPLDPDALKRMYSVAHAQYADELASSFIDKTFDLTFHITFPVPSDWRAYFAKRLRLVLGQSISPDWVYWSCAFYETLLELQSYTGDVLLSGVPRLLTTPRRINILVNDIAATWLQSNALGVSFYSVAYFCVFRSAINTDLRLETQSPKAGIDQLDPSWSRNIAAIHFGARPEIAVQILLEQPIRDAITKYEQDEFSSHARTPGFEQVLLKVLANPPNDPGPEGGLQPSFVGNASRLLSGLDLPASPWVAVAWDQLRSAFAQSAPWTDFNEMTVEEIRALLSRAPEVTLPAMIAIVRARLATIVTPPPFDFEATAKPFLSAVALLRDVCKQRSMEMGKVRVPGGGDAFLKTYSQCRNEEIRSLIEPSVAVSNMVTELADLLGEDSSSAWFEPELRALLAYEPEGNFDKLAETASKVLGNSGSQPVMTAALSGLGLLRSRSSVGVTGIQQAIATDSLTSRLNEAYAENNGSAVAKAISLFILHGTTVPRPRGASWDEVFNQLPDLPGEISKHLMDFDGPENTDILFEKAKAQSDFAPLAIAIISYRVANNWLGPLQTEDIMANIGWYLKHVDEPNRLPFLDKLTGYQEFWEDLQRVTNFESVSRIVRSQMRTDAPSREKALAFSKSLLENATEAAWNDAVAKGQPLFEIARSVSRVAKPTIRIGTPLADALRELIPGLLVSADDELRDRWIAAATLLRTPARKGLFQNLCDQIDNGTAVTDLTGLLATGEAALIRQAGFEKRADDSIRYVVEPLLDDQDGCAFLQKHADAISSWIKRASDTAKHNLSGRIFDRLREVDSESPFSASLTDLKSRWDLPEMGSGADEIGEA